MGDGERPRAGAPASGSDWLPARSGVVGRRHARSLHGLSYGIAFAVAMVVVVFLHMVIGEMAPKSWAIAHPERSAMLLSPPFRAVVRTVRPLIRLLNALSNALVRLCRVAPREELASVHNREQLTPWWWSPGGSA